MYFCDVTCQNAIPKVLSQKNATWNNILEPSFPGIGITPVSDRILGHSMHSGIFFFFLEK
jgi:hypothetical protein